MERGALGRHVVAVHGHQRLDTAIAKLDAVTVRGIETLRTQRRAERAEQRWGTAAPAQLRAVVIREWRCIGGGGAVQAAEGLDCPELGRLQSRWGLGGGAAD